ncbi:DUF2590 family protein [Pseudoalteromonas obscura]|uniref:DUF2590 family protein n=1 Tax=Pseudoalteromonas obscura TaxID=3048491 RepID=A0ABT7ES64_9GAMM|nr:DUF2590 family protein [Pseudoalteromonas sp. P94(2023)]MDK2597897.1 DUF2590 family protein [Pseudoalteromonas sp. P94(2023)]
MSLFRDLHIKNGDVVLDAGANPTYLADRDVIAQDVVHAILDSGLAHLLIGDRQSSVTRDTHTRITLLVEDDPRIKPGTVRVEQGTDGHWWVFARTLDFGDIHTKFTGGAHDGN